MITAMTSQISVSLSARRAWIEIVRFTASLILPLSLSARRAWIEIEKRSRGGYITKVALRKESVDRNGHYEYITAAEPRRSPQGERG